MLRAARVLCVSSLPLLLACGPAGPEEALQVLAGHELRADERPPSPTNAWADDSRARELGRRLFFDRRMSADGRVSCASCHMADEGFSDARPLSEGVAGRLGARHSMPVTAVAWQSFLFWDGRADSLWSQPLKAIESRAEMDFSRTEVAHFIAANHRESYEATFGPLPSLAHLPARARPGQPAWDELPESDREAVDRVFANVGKAIEAFERELSCGDTRFDRWIRGELELTPVERSGATAFVRNGCIACHSGPAFSDGAFHDLGLDEGDSGRAAGLEALLEDPFNGAGAWSDDPDHGRAVLAAARAETHTDGAFRTASLRGVGQRRAFGHLGDTSPLHVFIAETYGGRPGRDERRMDPLLREVRTGNLDALVAFLHTLNCPPPPGRPE